MMNQRFVAFDLFKFMASIGIALLHFNWKLIPQGYLLVEMFFILSGFLLYVNIDRYIQNESLLILTKKITKFYFLYLLTLLIQIILHGLPTLADFIGSLFFLGDIGIGNKFTYGAFWFLGCYIYIYIFYIFMFKSFSKQHSLFMTGIIVFVSICSIYTFSTYHAINITLEKTVGPFSFGLLRAIIGIGLGIMLASINKNKKLSSNLFSFLSLCCLGLLIFYLFRNITVAYDYINYIVMSLLILTLSGQNKFAKFFNFLGERFKYIYSLSLPIYIFHCVVIDIFNILKIHNCIVYLLFVLLLAVCVERIQKIVFNLMNFSKNR